MTTSQVVVFFGTEHFSAPSLRAVIAAGYRVEYVVTKPDTARGRGKVTASPEVKKIAIEHGIKVLQPTKLAEIYDTLSSLDAPCGILVAYGKIIPQSIIDLFTPGIINVHPSLLPKYRGPSPLEAAILGNDKKTGITIMQLIDRMDAGPIYTHIEFSLSQTETKPELYEQCAQKGARLLIDTLPDILNGSIHAIPQQDEHATYCSLLNKAHGIMSPEHKTASELEREVRAYLGFPKSQLTLFAQSVIVTSSHVVSSPDAAPLTISCHDNTYLSIDELIAPSGKRMNAEAFIRGYKQS